MCRSQQVNEGTEHAESSDKECNLGQNFDSCDEFEINLIEPDYTSMDQDEPHIESRLDNKNVTQSEIRETKNIKRLITQKPLIKLDKLAQGIG